MAAGTWAYMDKDAPLNRYGVANEVYAFGILMLEVRAFTNLRLLYCM